MDTSWFRLGAPFLAVALAGVSVFAAVILIGLWAVNEYRQADVDVYFEPDDEEDE